MVTTITKKSYGHHSLKLRRRETLYIKVTTITKKPYPHHGFLLNKEDKEGSSQKHSSSRLAIATSKPSSRKSTLHFINITRSARGDLHCPLLQLLQINNPPQ